jgi:putative transposase
MAGHKAMIDRKHELPVTRQAQLLGLSRGSVYCVAQPTSAADLALMGTVRNFVCEPVVIN